ncbi:hypothetical protein SLS60_000910 [Paraconiothyrium brasiliense]|uniref:Uncharacterized protein n=1 Tax=Paraconiothyrium brasiliense TaxID=300254 RepID=A0ABR3S7K7_9PLEO
MANIRRNKQEPLSPKITSRHSSRFHLGAGRLDSRIPLAMRYDSEAVAYALNFLVDEPENVATLPDKVTQIVIAHDWNGELGFFGNISSYHPYKEDTTDGYYDYANRSFEYEFDEQDEDKVADAKARSSDKTCAREVIDVIVDGIVSHTISAWDDFPMTIDEKS